MVNRVVHWPLGNRLIYLAEKATPQFWDTRWQAEGKPSAVSLRDPVVTATPRYLSAGARVLEGGCGRANKVKAMADAGFAAIGVDFAEETVRQARLNYPGLDIRQGDVRALDFPAQSFDGYWSIGVIEHFWDGYDAILAEAARVLRPKGFLFLTAPWFSPLRKRKARAGDYATADYQDEPELFYQFALSREEVSSQLGRHGFQLLRWSGLASEISMREDMLRPRRLIKWLLDSRGSVVKRGIRRTVARSLNSFCGHSFLAIAQRKRAGI